MNQAQVLRPVDNPVETRRLEVEKDVDKLLMPVDNFSRTQQWRGFGLWIRKCGKL
jgi:hypothetical protein